MSEQTANLCTTDAAESLREIVAERDREIERLRLNIAEYNEHERCYQEEIVALKEGQEKLIFVRDDYKNQAHDYRARWASAIASGNAPAGDIEAIRAEFPLFDDADLDQETHHCEWSVQNDRKRLHKLLAALKAQPSGVVLPERKHTDWRAGAGHETPSHGWNACLDEVARLNSSPVSSAPSHSEQVRAWCGGVEAAVNLIDKKAEDYATEHGHDDMGGLSFGTGQHAQIKADYHSSLIELAAEVLGLLAAAPSAGSQEQGE